MLNIWNERFGREEYAYGIQPNEYFKKKVKNLVPGEALFPGEGEGRNAVYAAQLGWEAYAFDSSTEGAKKAQQLARSKKVTLHYILGGVEDIHFEPESFDLLVLIFAHFPEDKRRVYHRKLSKLVKKGGRLILEGFSKAHEENQRENASAGGPRVTGMLYDLEELKEDFDDFDLESAYEKTTLLKEGRHHNGKGTVIRLFGIKK